jgi:hypothetical protein
LQGQANPSLNMEAKDFTRAKTVDETHAVQCGIEMDVTSVAIPPIDSETSKKKEFDDFCANKE